MGRRIIKTACLFIATILLVATLFAAASFDVAAEEGTVVWIEEQTVTAGNSFSFYIQARNLENVGTLSVSLYYDTEQFEISSVSTQPMISNQITSSNTQTAGTVKLDFISLDGVSGSGDLWRVTMKAKSTATPGKHTLTLAVGEAYTEALSPIVVSSENALITVNERAQSIKNVYFYSSRTKSSLTLGEQTTLTLYSNNMQGLAAMDFEIEYDHTLLRLDEIKLGERMLSAEGATYSIHDKNPGYIKISYIALNGIVGSVSPIISLKFTALQNLDTSATVNFKPSNIFDANLDPMNTSQISTVLSIYKSEVAIDLPDVTLSNYEGVDDAFELQLEIPGELDLAAADFSFDFDPQMLKCINVERLDTTHLMFFNIDNEKGKITVSFIDEDGVEQTEAILRILFSTEGLLGGDTNVSFVGKNMVDFNLDPIEADFVGGSIVLHKHGTPADCTNEEVCSVPGCEKVIAERLGHDEIHNSAQAPTCTEIGWDAYVTCSRCDYSTYVENKALGHEEILHEAKAPTCTEIGWDAYVTCSRCDYSTYVEKASLGHTHAKPIIENTVDASCIAEGSYDSVVYCSVCNVELSREAKTIDKLGHDEVSHEAKAPTCTEIGWNAYVTCSRCDYSTYVEKASLGHTHAKPVIENTVDASCTAEGSYDSVVYCSVCNVELSREVKAIEKLGHDYNTTWSTNASSHWHECTKCGDKKDLTSHTAGAAATESTAQTCTVCGYVITPALGHTHNYKTEWSNNATEHWHDCVGCNSIKDNEPHDYTNACDTDCNTCGYVRTITHSYKTEWSSNAEKHWYECSVCGDKSSEANHIPGAEATETTDQVCTICSYVIQVSLGHTHNYENIKKDDANHWKECACGEKNEITAHTWNNGEVTKEATVDEEGVKTYTCTLCSCTKNESIAKLVTNVKNTESGVTLEIPSNSQATLPTGTVIEVVDRSGDGVSKQILGGFAETAETMVEVLGVYDLNLLLDGVKIQPNGAVVVTLPAPKLSAEYDRIIVVFIADDGSYEECKTTVNTDGTISFETDHFSTYAVIGVREEEADGGIGIGAIVAIIVGVVFIVGGAFAIYWLVIKKKSKPVDENETDTRESANDEAEDAQQ